ncbi:MAG: TrmB family transcriptional regulator [Anaerolineales bacterium]|jgi:Cd2+/Zn2+-exporting ATPase
MDLLQELMAVGFTEYESKVYLALLRESPATGYQLSKNAGVPRSMVYEALGRLAVRGAVMRTDDRRSTLYRPVPPDILLDRYAKEHQTLIESLRKDLNAMFDAQSEDYFWSIKGYGAVQSFATQMIDSAVVEILLVLNDRDLEALNDILANANARGVTISALLTGDRTLDYGQVVRHPPLESEAQELTQMLVIVADNQQVLIANTDIETSATITSNNNLVLIARQFIWMELFAQRIYARMGPDVLSRLDPQDRRLLEGFTTPSSK